MRALVHLSAALGLAACASGPVHVSADRCWSVAAGDKVEGAAILFVASPFTFHVGPKVAGGRDCPRYPIRLANQAVDKAYREIIDAPARVDPSGGPSAFMVRLNGDVMSGVDGGMAIIHLTSLAPLPSPNRHQPYTGAASAPAP